MEETGFEIVRPLVQDGAYAVVCARLEDGRVMLVETAHAGVSGEAPPVPADVERFDGLTGPGLLCPVEFQAAPSGPFYFYENDGVRPLSEELAGGPPAVERVVDILATVAAGIATLHDQGIRHGAISPSTIWCADSGTPVWLGGFGHPARLAGGGAAPTNRTLRYLSPEQTGRIGRQPDHRSDFYSFGVVGYALLTGAPPFAGDDALEIIHGHIARVPKPIAEDGSAARAMLAAVVLRLLAKSADERYQTARGLVYDLERCRAALGGGDPAGTFRPGLRDGTERLVVGRGLFGRDREREELAQAYDRVRDGGTGMVLVSGYSGVGKSALIGDFLEAAGGQGARVIAGKFDQIARSLPYGALIQAWKSLVRQLLGESDAGLAVVRARLTEALGVQASVLTAVVPELGLILGPSDPALAGEAAEPQNRFQYACERFVAAVARPDQPLVLALDDLQWADAASLELLHTILTRPSIAHVLVIAAYRDHEVDAGHLVTFALDRLAQSGAWVHRLPLTPLSPPALSRLLASVLGGSAEEALPLAELLMRRTDGNPFFVIEFLRALARDGVLRFQEAADRWTFDLDAVAAARSSPTVADLVSRRIESLSLRGQRALTLAACLGDPFDRQTLVAVAGASADDVITGLDEAREAGLVVPAASRYGESAGAAHVYAFLHDRVQMLAYRLIGEDRRAALHLRIGLELLGEEGERLPDDRLFAVLHHLNAGAAEMRDPARRLATARLNLAAGRRARAAGAYRAAVGYLEAGAALLDREARTAEADLHFALDLDAAECQYLAGDVDDAHERLQRLEGRASGRFARAEVLRLLALVHESRAQYAEAAARAHQALSLFDLTLPGDEGTQAARLDETITAIEHLRGGRPIVSLVDADGVPGDDVRTVLRLLMTLWSSSYLAGRHLLTRLISATMVRLSLEHGNVGFSAYGYVTHAITIGPVRGDYESAYEWGELALLVNERCGDLTLRAKIVQQFHAHVQLWRRPFEECVPNARLAMTSGLEAGDVVYAAYGAMTETWPAFLSATDLDAFGRRYAPRVAFLEALLFAGLAVAVRLLLAWAQALQGRTRGPLSLGYEGFDEDGFLAAHAGNAFLMNIYLAARLQLCVLAGAWDEARVVGRRAMAVAQTGTIWPVVVAYWMALAETAPGADAAIAGGDAAAIETAERLLERLAVSAPANFRSWWLILRACQRARAGSPAEGVALCEEAALVARGAGRVQDEALACELAGRFGAQAGDDDRAHRRLTEAGRTWRRWGAARAHALEDGRARGEAPTSADVSLAGPAELPVSPDLATVLKVARAMASQIELDRLLQELLRLAIENAGAERGAFLRLEGDGLVLEAEARTDDVAGEGAAVRRPAQPLESVGDLPRTVIRYVARTAQAIVLDDARLDGSFGDDADVRRRGVRSILCVPISYQARLPGVLYLENHLVAGAFTPARLEMMRILAVQAAIAMENARAYDAARQEAARRGEAERALQDALQELRALKDRLEAENVYLQEEIRTEHNFEEIVGNSPVLLTALRRIERVAPTDSSVLIVGETGTGKELFARAIHSRSPRRRRPLVKVNCGAIAPGLVESELFGHVKGAFTGAVERRIGRFELADGGTIFLDEVGELSLEAQVKLLRVLQEGEFEPVGSSRSTRVDVRVIAATNRDLDRAVQQGTFRSDLLYRLNVVPVTVPPLRERRSDVPLLVAFFVNGIGRRLGKPLHGFSAQSMERLVAYDWPGNVRELQNVVERAAVLASGAVLDIDLERQGATAPGLPQSLDDLQRLHIASVLESTGGVVEGVRGAAAILGLHPNTLRSRMKKLGIVVPRVTADFRRRAPGG